MGKITQDGHYTQTLKLAKEARGLFISGKTREEIVKIMGKSMPQIDRYFLMLPRITNEERAMHFKNRYLRKSKDISSSSVS